MYKKIKRKEQMPKRKKEKEHSNFLETEREHKKWYDIESGMGKQRGKPRAVPQNVKKPKGSFKKHHHQS